MRKELFLSTFLFAMLCVQPDIISSELHRAVIEKDLFELARLLNEGEDANKKDELGNTPLHLAVTQPSIKDKKIDMRAIEILEEKGAKVDVQNKEGNTPLRLAVLHPVVIGRKIDMSIIENLVKKGAKVNEKDKEGNTPLHLAVLHPVVIGSKIDISIMENFVKKGAKVDSQNKKGFTPLHFAVLKPVIVDTGKQKGWGKIKGLGGVYRAGFFFSKILPGIVKFLIEQGAKREIKTEDGRTPLGMAFHGGYVKIEAHRKTRRRLPSRRGGEFAYAEEVGKWWIRDNDKGVIIEALFEKGVDPSKPLSDGVIPIIFAVEKGLTKTLEFFMKKGANPNVKDKNGDTPLLIAVKLTAARNRKIDIVAKLIEGKANLNVKDKNGDTPLFIAVKSGRIDMVAKLLEGKANPNVKDKNGDTPLLIAVKNGRIDIVARLLEGKANPNFKDKNGDTPLLIAVKIIAANNGKIDIVEKLLEGKANPNVEDKNGYTPLLIAVKNGRRNIVARLLEGKANPNLKNKHGRSAYDISYKIYMTLGHLGSLCDQVFNWAQPITKHYEKFIDGAFVDEYKNIFLHGNKDLKSKITNRDKAFARNYKKNVIIPARKKYEAILKLLK